MQDIIKSLFASVKLRGLETVKEAMAKVKRDLMPGDEEYIYAVEIFFILLAMKNPVQSLRSVWGLVVEELERDGKG